MVESQTISGSRSDSGGYMILGFGLAFGCVVVCVVDRASVQGWLLFSAFALVSAGCGLRSLLDVITPPQLQLTATGFVFRRALAAVREVNWRDIETISAFVTPRGYQSSIGYRLRDGTKGSFALHGANYHDLVELMKDYRDLDAIGPQAAAAFTTASPAPAFGHQLA